jgi:hypothetical protein
MQNLKITLPLHHHIALESVGSTRSTRAAMPSERKPKHIKALTVDIVGWVSCLLHIAPVDHRLVILFGDVSKARRSAWWWGASAACLWTACYNGSIRFHVDWSQHTFCMASDVIGRDVSSMAPVLVRSTHGHIVLLHTGALELKHHNRDYLESQSHASSHSSNNNDAHDGDGGCNATP